VGSITAAVVVVGVLVVLAAVYRIRCAADPFTTKGRRAPRTGRMVARRAGAAPRRLALTIATSKQANNVVVRSQPPFAR
jgi:hypothetical protein